MNLDFTKMHGCGNDFVVVYDDQNKMNGEVAKRVCEKHFGVGADGLITLSMNPEFAEKAEAVPKWRMRIYNSDGSEAEMCGNGVRCAGKFLVDSSLASIGKIPILTKAGVRIPEVLRNSLVDAEVRVNMGEPVFYDPKQVSVEPNGEGAVRIWNKWPGITEFSHGYYVGMGNPHVVFFVESGKGDDLANRYGSVIENSRDIFPARTNVHFVEEGDFGKFRVYTWERGDGRTLACGTGACATYVAAFFDKRIPAGTPAEMILPGGELEIVWDGPKNPVYMTGPARNVFKGNLEFLIEG